ncbi:MAG TPA: PqqD family protein [Phycisphaerae bacterium]|nr:PqqD family protein [Phycisphaerae bacterium]
MKDRRSKGGAAKKDVTTAEYLRAVPFKNRAMEIARQSSGGILVSVPLKRPKYMVPPLSWILPFSSHRRVELDALGAEVLDLCDGKRSIEAVTERFASAHKLTFREAQLAVTEFLRQLTQRGLVAIVGCKEPVKG